MTTKKIEGELGVTASTNGRRLTLDNLIENLTEVALPRRRVENSLPAGLRQEWVSGETEVPEGKVEFDLTCGAGLGSPYMILNVTLPDGESRQEVVNVADLLPAWIEAILADGPTPAVA